MGEGNRNSRTEVMLLEEAPLKIKGIVTPENSAGIVDAKSSHKRSGNKFMRLNEEPLTVDGNKIPLSTRLSVNTQRYDSGSKFMRLNEEALRIVDNDTPTNSRIL